MGAPRALKRRRAFIERRYEMKGSGFMENIFYAAKALAM